MSLLVTHTHEVLGLERPQFMMFRSYDAPHKKYKITLKHVLSKIDLY